MALLFLFSQGWSFSAPPLAQINSSFRYYSTPPQDGAKFITGIAGANAFSVLRASYGRDRSAYGVDPGGKGRAAKSALQVSKRDAGNDLRLFGGILPIGESRTLSASHMRLDSLGEGVNVIGG
jgi:hypothetical protein